jgi:hypothetical protein
VKPLFTMREALTDPNLLGDVLVGDSWATWRAMLIAAMGEQLTDDERVLFTRFTGRQREPLERVEEAAFVVGRRGGKDRSTSVLATYIAGCCEHPKLVRGECGVLMLLAPDTDQAAIQLNYIKGAFETSPILRELIVSSNRDTLSLQHKDDDGRAVADIDVEVHAANFRRLRGRTCIACICTESAFWYDAETSANPDTEIVGAARPALLTTGGPMIFISSPYARRGVLWSMYRRHYGPEGDPLVLVAQGTSADFNPTVAGDRKILRAYEEDPASAAAEYGGEFRTDIESFVSREAVESLVSPGLRERAPLPAVQYRAFCDPAGGGGQDSMTLAIVHREKDVRVLDCVREVRPPFNPSEVVADFCETLKSYRVSRVYGDKYAGEWPAEAFAKKAVTYEPCGTAKSDIYKNSLPLINTGKLALLDVTRLVNQLCALERRTARGGRDSIDHPPKGHDDVCNAAMGALVLLGGVASSYSEALKAAIPTIGDAQRPHQRQGMAGLIQHIEFYRRLGRPF